MPNNKRERSDAIQAAARALIEAHRIDINETVNIRPLADELVISQECTLETARRHIAKAVRRMRHEASEEAEKAWGGSRPGAGRKSTNSEYYAISAAYAVRDDHQNRDVLHWYVLSGPHGDRDSAETAGRAEIGPWRENDLERDTLAKNMIVVPKSRLREYRINPDRIVEVE